MKYNLYVEDVSVEAVFNKLGGVGGAKRFLADELLLVEAPKPEPPPEPPLDFFVRVDRSVKPSYPNWMKEVMHPELECAGPAEYHLQELDLWFYYDQQILDLVQGNTIYTYLQKGDALATCLNLQDGLAIQQKGIAVFRKLLADKAVAVFLWGSVVQGQGGGLHVPFLCEDGVRVVVCWRWLGNNWDSNDPALSFACNGDKLSVVEPWFF